MTLHRHSQGLYRRIRRSVVTVPCARAWGGGALLLVILAVLVLPVGVGSGFFVFALPHLSWTQQLALALAAFVAPSFVEELVFRVLLLPLPTPQRAERRGWRWGLAGTAIFVLYHPLKAITISPMAPAQVFLDPRFLFFAAALGACCTYSYLRTRSIWVPPTGILNPVPGSGWAARQHPPRNASSRKKGQTTTSAYLFLDVKEQRMWVDYAAHTNSTETLTRLWQRMAHHQRLGHTRLVVIWDQASWHMSKKVRHAIREHNRVLLHRNLRKASAPKVEDLLTDLH